MASAQIVLDSFSGPLSLLLELIENEKLPITEIALSRVTEQYLAHLSKVDERATEELADFLVVATRLVYLKSRALLPYLLPPDEAEGPSLADQLKLYKRYADASQHIAEGWSDSTLVYGRERERATPRFSPPNTITPELLGFAMRRVVERLTPVTLPQVTVARTVSVKEKVQSLLTLLKKIRRLSFNDIVHSAENRSDAIVSFLAVLELVKQRSARIDQERAFGELIIQPV